MTLIRSELVPVSQQLCAALLRVCLQLLTRIRPLFADFLCFFSVRFRPFIAGGTPFIAESGVLPRHRLPRRFPSLRARRRQRRAASRALPPRGRLLTTAATAARQAICVTALHRRPPECLLACLLSGLRARLLQLPALLPRGRLTADAAATAWQVARVRHWQAARVTALLRQRSRTRDAKQGRAVLAQRLRRVLCHLATAHFGDAWGMVATGFAAIAPVIRATMDTCGRIIER